MASSASRPQRWAEVLSNETLLEDMHDYFTYAQVRCLSSAAAVEAPAQFRGAGPPAPLA